MLLSEVKKPSRALFVKLVGDFYDLFAPEERLPDFFSERYWMSDPRNKEGPPIQRTFWYGAAPSIELRSKLEQYLRAQGFEVDDKFFPGSPRISVTAPLQPE